LATAGKVFYGEEQEHRNKVFGYGYHPIITVGRRRPCGNWKRADEKYIIPSTLALCLPSLALYLGIRALNHL